MLIQAPAKGGGISSRNKGLQVSDVGSVDVYLGPEAAIGTENGWGADDSRQRLAIPGHDGLFARGLPIAFSCFSHVDTRGFCRRRFDLFAIVRLAWQSWMMGSCENLVNPLR
jgi:hypothetical protein